MGTGLEIRRKFCESLKLLLIGNVFRGERVFHCSPCLWLVGLSYGAEETVTSLCDLGGRVGEVLRTQVLEGSAVNARYCLVGWRVILAAVGVAVATEAGGGRHDWGCEEGVVVECPIPVAASALVESIFESLAEDLRSRATVSALAERIEVALGEVPVPGQERCLVVDWKSPA